MAYKNPNYQKEYNRRPGAKKRSREYERKYYIDHPERREYLKEYNKKRREKEKLNKLLPTEKELKKAEEKIKKKK